MSKISSTKRNILYILVKENEVVLAVCNPQQQIRKVKNSATPISWVGGDRRGAYRE